MCRLTTLVAFSSRSTRNSMRLLRISTSRLHATKLWLCMILELESLVWQIGGRKSVCDRKGKQIPLLPYLSKFFGRTFSLVRLTFTCLPRLCGLPSIHGRAKTTSQTIPTCTFEHSFHFSRVKPSSNNINNDKRDIQTASDPNRYRQVMSNMPARANIMSNTNDSASIPSPNVALSVYDIQHELENASNTLKHAIDEKESPPQVIALLQQAQQQVSSTYIASKHLLNAFGGFSLFNKLPTEIRHQIWLHSLPESRIIEVVFDVKKNIGRLLAKGGVPATLQVCRESRQIALRTYSGKLQGASDNDRYFRVDPQREMVYLTSKHGQRSREQYEKLKYCVSGFGGAFSLFHKSSLHDIRLLAFDEWSWDL